MTMREEILQRIRGRLGAASDDARQAAVRERLGKRAPGVIPCLAASGKDLIELFAAKARAAAATVDMVGEGEEGPAILNWLRGHNLAPALRRGEDARLAGIRWPKGAAPQVEIGPSTGEDLSALSHAYAGIGETGTLVLLSGSQNPTTLNFLPENHIVILRAGDIGPDHETVWRRLRAELGETPPRTINMITGPSRSADIEQTLILGAHGPTRLHIVIVG